MTRDEFLRKLASGLTGMTPAAIDDIMSDYAAHFDAARDEGRSDAEVGAGARRSLPDRARTQARSRGPALGGGPLAVFGAHAR